MRTLAPSGVASTAARRAAARRANVFGWAAFVAVYGFALLVVALT